ncbi:hypothetical protein BH11BAC7_BH11BAC7_23140 [soil metagenome]
MKQTFTLIALSLFSFCANAQWDTLNTQTSTDFNSISFSDNWNGVAVGQDPITGKGAAYFTVSAGLNWVPANMATNSLAINDVGFFPSSSFGFAVGDSGQVFICNTNVMTISAPMQVGTNDFYCVFPANDSVNYIGGDNGVLYRTSDYGTSWDTLDVQSTQPIRDIYFMNALVGWIVCDGGYIGYTIDGGQTWTAQPQDFSGFFQCKSIAFAGTNGYVIGDGGFMVNSTDAGLSWNIFSSVTAQNLTCLRFVNSLGGVMCGDNGAIYRTNTGGLNWTNESMTIVTQKLNKVCFSSDSVAFICGENGRILKSNTDVSSVTPNVMFTMNAIAYPNPFDGDQHLRINLEKASAVLISVTDVAGRIVLQENAGELNAGENTISPAGMSSLVNGMYLVQITTSYGSVSIPVIRK